ncbi:L-seryl-tRNA(Sec) selenium transferase [Rubrobacter indicoceani]|uniref:L-seryl-tRNA(Sec) selenium transferase n=1 Tax=Rubrobacter indicoceani TaxID=2051957 RepID=UPI000E5BAC66|nr:L-seryl-tRNA(Sec) selenium transferase [Rubrobacter indicoceani]
MESPKPYNGSGEALRRLPAVDAVLRSSSASPLLERYGAVSVTGAVRSALGETRDAIFAGCIPDLSIENIVLLAGNSLEGRGLRRVVNATGVILHTNLGRSVLSEKAVEAVFEAATGYSNLEYSVPAGRRGSRYDHAVPLLTELTGAEDALVVNNCAGATLLALAAAVDGEPGSEVIVSRGQLIEIGGGFRIPEVLEVSGATLREVGTTNRTRLADYDQAINDATRAVLWVHPSNFEVVGFTESVGVKELCTLGQTVIADVGSGAMLPLADEPRITEAVKDGADLVIFSGDKLLGGPQAGIIVGKKRLIRKMRSHPLTRALRADKLCLAALEATLKSYLDGTAAEELPTQRMLNESAEVVGARAGSLAERLREASPGPLAFEVVGSVARSGGGTLPNFEVLSAAVRVGGTDADTLARGLRRARVPVVGRVYNGSLLLDARTLLPGDEGRIVAAFQQFFGAADG